MSARISRTAPVVSALTLALAMGGTLVASSSVVAKDVETFNAAYTAADAARKGANYVQIRQTGAMGTSVKGKAYLCL